MSVHCYSSERLHGAGSHSWWSGAPSILIDQKNLPDRADSHVGTMDLDLGLTLAKTPTHQNSNLGEIKQPLPSQIAKRPLILRSTKKSFL